MQVEVDRDIGVSAKNVGELRKIPSWPDNLVITTPQERYPESAIKVSKASVTIRSRRNRRVAVRRRLIRNQRRMWRRRHLLALSDHSEEANSEQMKQCTRRAVALHPFRVRAGSRAVVTLYCDRASVP